MPIPTAEPTPPPEQAKSAARAAKDPSAASELQSLAPRYVEWHHEVYVKALAHALRDGGGNRNIALTGAYGTGKSSVLKGLTERVEFRGRVLELSLSTVGVTEPRPEGDSDANPAAWTKVNVIQKEIVKQILYRDPPEKTRGSRFRRLSRFHWLREIGIAVWVASLLVAMGWMLGLTSQLPLLGESADIAPTAFTYGSLLAILAGVIYSLRWLTHNRVFLERLSAGPATVSLAPTAANFFDQYMDEIIYYFEQSGRDIIIFEDIDRFDDVHIFETLRALNSLLNGAEQIRRRRGTRPGRDVKFVYALRDSVFEQLGIDPGPVTQAEQVNGAKLRADEAEAEMRRANRTKFFDLVIPIVPFVTHRNARDLMLKAMKGTEVSPDLISVAAQHVADMRLITDLRNEYAIYASRLLAEPNRMPGLTADRLFALVLYKCVHMADFEAIRLGTSSLDRLHDAWREIVNDSLRDAYERKRTATAQLDEVGIGVARASAMGDRLEDVAHALIPQRRYVASTYVSVDGTQFRGDELRQPEFWRLVTGGDPSIVISNPPTGLSFSLSVERLATLLDQPIDAANWKQADRAAALKAQRSASEDIDFLKHHDWHEIHLRQFRSSPSNGSPESFAEATERIMRSRLARALVAGGYLDDYYALYVSEYYGQHLRPRALNFAIHVLDRGIPDASYELDAEDVEAIIKDKGTSPFQDRAAYNVSVLDHFLHARSTEAEMVVHLVSAWGARDREFAEVYLKAGKRQVEFVRLLAPLIPKVIMSYVIDAPPKILAQVVDAALDYSGPEVEGTVANQVVLDHYPQFPSITTADGNDAPVDLRRHRTIDAIAQLGIQLPNTAHLKPDARHRACELGAYQLNESNIANLTGQDSLALDDIRASNPSVYQVALARVGEYVDLVRRHAGTVTISNPKQFLPILTDIDEAAIDQHQLVPLIDGASAGCRVESLATAPESTWSVLASTRRTAPSASNLLAYLDHAGAIDDNAARLLEPGDRISHIDDLDDADRLRLAVAILNAGEFLPSPQHRAHLAVSLEPRSAIPISSLMPESGQLPMLLIEAKLLPDEEATFSSPLMVDWTTREAALSHSRNATDFITPGSLPPETLPDFFDSAAIPKKLKTAVLGRLSEFMPGSSIDAARAAAAFAITIRADLPHCTIDQLRMGASDKQVVELLVSSSSVTIDEVRDQLRTMNDPYRALADPGTNQPLVPDDEAHRNLLDKLKDAGIVSTHAAEKNNARRVHLKRPPSP